MLYLVLVAIVTFNMQAMEQLSPRSKQVVHEIGQLFKTRCDEQGIAQEKQRLILGALMDTSAPTVCQTVDDWNNFIVKGLWIYQQTYLGKVIDISSNHVIELWENEIRKYHRKSNTVEIVYKAPAPIERFSYLSEKTFAIQTKDHIYLYHNGKIIFEEKVDDGPFCLNATGTILVYGNGLEKGTGQLKVNYTVLGSSSIIEIECLKRPAAIENWMVYPALAHNPANQNEIVCLCETGFLYILDIATAQIKKRIKAFDKIFLKKVRVSPNGRYIAASSDKILKIWDTVDNFREIVSKESADIIIDLHFSPKGNCLAVVDNGVDFLSMKSMQCTPYRLAEPCTKFRFMPDGLTCMTELRSTIKLWQLAQL